MCIFYTVSPRHSLPSAVDRSAARMPPLHLALLSADRGIQSQKPASTEGVGLGSGEPLAPSMGFVDIVVEFFLKSVHLADDSSLFSCKVANCGIISLFDFMSC